LPAAWGGLCLALLIVGGCASPHAFPGRPEDLAGIRRVAVLPFENTTSFSDAGPIVTGAFLSALVESDRFQVEFPGNVRNFFIRERIIVRSGVDLEAIALLRDRLGVDAVLMGQIEEFAGTADVRRAVVPKVMVTVRMIDARTGAVLFMSRHGRRGDDGLVILDFGQIRTPGELSKRLAREVIAAMTRATAKGDEG
jgi:TolB-like protein